MSSNFYIPKEPLVTQAVQSFWQADHHTSFRSEFIVPKGIVEIIFNFSDTAPLLSGPGNTSAALPKCFINGYNRNPILVHLPPKQVYFGIRLHPQAIKKIFGYPAAEFADLTIDLALIDPGFISLWHGLAEQDSFDQRVLLFSRHIKTHLIEWQPREQLLNSFLANDKNPELSVTMLSKELCYSPRHLSRKISEVTGMNTEEILLYKKYLHALELIQQTDLSLTEIAYQSGFTDQSHFIRSFKHYTGLTPGEYRRNKSYLKGHLFRDVR